MKANVNVLVVAVCLFAAQCLDATCCAQELKRQTTFCEDGAPENLLLKPAPVPQDVLNAVVNSEEGREAIADTKAKGMKLDPEKVLQGTTIRLSGDGVATFLLMGSYPLAGADNTWFWIVRRSGQAASVLFGLGATVWT
jgi:hypothetical protein